MSWLTVGIGAFLLATAALLGWRSRQGQRQHHDLWLFGSFSMGVVGLLLLMVGLQSAPIPETADLSASTATPAVRSTATPPATATASVTPSPTNIPVPTPTATPTPVPLSALFEGISYARDERTSPRPLVIHIVKIDLSTPGISFLVTPPQPTGGRELAARTTSEFLTIHDLQLAINGGNFYPFEYGDGTDFYPQSGEPVDVSGLAASRGEVYGSDDDHPTLYISAENQATFNTPIGGIYNAVSGQVIFLQDGKLLEEVVANGGYSQLHPRTVVALDAARQTLLIIVVDGRQLTSGGMSLREVAQVVLQYGGDTALNLDGGGSTTLVMGGQGGRSVQLNTPIHKSPGQERPVGNHLGVYAGSDN